jgi:glycosyltransferase involved in cell wall biosynthesis
MKLLVFAHTPPPHHGQSYMVRLMLDGFGGDRRHQQRGSNGRQHDIECYHVNVRLSQRLEDIGDFQIGKFFLLAAFCLQAIWCRFRYGVTNFYYIPAPGKRSALYRDWMVMFLCRPFFKRVILHWHAAGMAKWLETAVQMRWRATTYRAMKDVDLSIVLSHYNRADAEKLFPKRIRVVSNGIPDPCPDFERAVLPRRKARFHARSKLLTGQPLTEAESKAAGNDPHILHVLYLAHCMREKGLFDTLAGIQLANKRLTENGSPVSLRLLVTGNFVTAEEKVEFDKILSQPDVAKIIRYAGFISGEGKDEALRDADLFCFPTYYQNENQPVNLIEALAFGVPILTTRWRSIPELLPKNYPGLVDVRSPEQVADCLLALMKIEPGESFRELFVRNFTLEQHLSGLAAALHSVERAAETVPPKAAVSAAHR